MKNFKNIFLFLFQLLLLIQKIQTQNDSSNITKNYNYLELFIRSFAALENRCYQELANYFDSKERSKLEKDKTYPWIGDYFGQGINDIGDETECIYSIKQNTTFFMINFYKLNISDILEANLPLKNFLEIKNFTLGLCIMYDCGETLRKYIGLLAEFVNYISDNKTSDENLVSLIESNNIDKDKKDNAFFDNDLETRGVKMFFVYLFGTIVLFKIIACFIRIIMIPKGYDKYVAEKINKLKKLKIKDEAKSDNSGEESKLSSSKASYNEELLGDFSSKDYNPLFDFSEKLPKWVRVLRFFDLINDFKYLSSKRNRYFNDSGLEILVFNRASVIFSLIFFTTFSTLIALPSVEIINSAFFSSWMNIFYRLSTNALTCWIFLEGAYTTYKLLSFISTEMFLYLKKEDRRIINWKLKLLIIYGKFLVLLLPKFLLFILIYFVIYFKIEDYRFTNNSPATFKHIIVNVFKEGITCDGIFSIFKFGFSTDINKYNACYEFTYFYINMILCIFIFMIIIYLFFVIQNKIFEYVIIGINFAIFLFSNLLVEDSKTKEDGLFLEYHIIGQTYSSKIFLSFIGFFHLGFIFGFMIFNFDNLKLKINRLIYEYNKGINLSKTKIKPEEINSNASICISEGLTESTNDNIFSSRTESLNLSDFEYDENSPNYYKNFKLDYYPMDFLKDMVKYIYRLKYSTKIICIISLFALMILIDLILLIYIFARKSFEMYLDGGKIFIFLYEKHFFIIFYFLINVILLTFPKKSAIRSFMSARIFVATSRLGFLITLVAQAFTYFSFIIFSIKVKFYVPTFAIISFGNFLVFFIVCSFLIFVTEFPLRIAIKKLMRIERNKERNKENISL